MLTPLQYLAGQGCPHGGRLFLCSMPYGNRDNENTFGKEREAYTAIDRPENYRAKLANASFRMARPGPPGFGEKSSSPGGLAVFFPKALPFRKRLP